MKLLKNIYSILLIGLLFTTASCSSDDDNPNSGPDSSGSITAKVDGGNFVGKTNTASVSHDLLVIVSEDNSGLLLSISASLFSGNGTYEIIKIDGFEKATGSYIASQNLWRAPLSENVQEGVITVTNYSNGKISGTFSFTGTNPVDGMTKTISEGKFENLDCPVLL